MGAIDYLNQHGLNAENLIDDQIAVWPEESITSVMELWIIEHKAQLVSELRRSGHTPNAVLLEIAQTLKADVHRLMALLSDDDMEDIAAGEHSREYLLAYFRLMRSDGKPLTRTSEPRIATRAPQSGHSSTAKPHTWKPAHDAMINHLMTCTACRAPRDSYCPEGARLRRAYLSAYQSEYPARLTPITMTSTPSPPLNPSFTGGAPPHQSPWRN